jgi:hypothetical protein
VADLLLNKLVSKKSAMKNNTENQQENKIADPIMRRGFLKQPACWFRNDSCRSIRSYAYGPQISAKEKASVRF